MSLTIGKQAKPGSGGNVRFWCVCECGRRLTLRRSQIAKWDCERCKVRSGAKTTKEK